jgi:hypothetical protein
MYRNEHYLTVHRSGEQLLMQLLLLLGDIQQTQDLYTMYHRQQQLQASLWEVAVQVQAGFKVQLHHLVSMVYLRVLRM